MLYICERAGARLESLSTPLAALDIFPPGELLPRLRLTRERIKKGRFCSLRLNPVLG